MSLYVLKPIECTTQKVNPKVNYRLNKDVLILDNQLYKCTTSVQDVNNRGNCVQGNSVLSDHFSAELKLL